MRLHALNQAAKVTPIRWLVAHQTAGQAGVIEASVHAVAVLNATEGAEHHHGCHVSCASLIHRSHGQVTSAAVGPGSPSAHTVSLLQQYKLLEMWHVACYISSELRYGVTGRHQPRLHALSTIELSATPCLYS